MESDQLERLPDNIAVFKGLLDLVTECKVKAMVAGRQLEKCSLILSLRDTIFIFANPSKGELNTSN